MVKTGKNNTNKKKSYPYVLYYRSNKIPQNIAQTGGWASSTEMRTRFSHSGPQYLSLACAYLFNIKPFLNIARCSL